MAKLNPRNERIKRDYTRHLKGARGKSEATLDAIRKALARYEDYTGGKDFGTFRKEQAIGFTERLSATAGQRTGETLSHSTQASSLAALREFFAWLAWQPGFKSKIHVPDIDYLSLSRKDRAKAKMVKLRDFPSLEQIRAAVAAMPAETVIDRRNRALLCFAILTGMRDRAMASLSLRHVDTTKLPPLVRQEPDRVETKFSKNIVTYFFPVGDDLRKIAVEWIEELRTQHFFAPNDPVFPRTRLGQGADHSFQAIGVEPVHWRDAAPIRAIFRNAFERAGFPYFPPHSFRHTLGHWMQTACQNPEQFKACSQNLGHENVATTFTSYGAIDPHRQGEVIWGISLRSDDDGAEVLARIRAMVS